MILRRKTLPFLSSDVREEDTLSNNVPSQTLLIKLSELCSLDSISFIIIYIQKSLVERKGTGNQAASKGLWPYMV